MRTLTRSEWLRNVRHGYASVKDGQRYILAYERSTGATVLEPVDVIGLRAASTPFRPNPSGELTPEIV